MKKKIILCMLTVVMMVGMTINPVFAFNRFTNHELHSGFVIDVLRENDPVTGWDRVFVLIDGYTEPKSRLMEETDLSPMDDVVVVLDTRETLEQSDDIVRDILFVNPFE